MKTFLGALQHLFATANKTHILWCCGILMVMLIIAILHHLWKDDSRKIRLWCLLCLIPLLICIVHFLIFLSGALTIWPAYIVLYIIALLALLPIPFAKRRIGYRISTVITGVLSVLCAFYFCATSPNVFNHIRESYTESFHSLVQDMDRKYILKEWKEADIPLLEAKYLPLVKEAEKEQDPAKFADAVTMFCNEFHDGHISVEVQFDDDEKSLKSVFTHHNYGFATVKLDSGEVIAVCTDKEANDLGIIDSTVITKWNGKPVLQAAAEDVPDMGIPVKANEDILDVLFLDMAGGKTVEVSFLDKDGNEQTVTVKEITDEDRVFPSFTALAAFRSIQPPIDYEKLLEENFSTKMLDDKCGYLKLTAETMVSAYKDYIGYLKGDQTFARELFREKLNDLKAQGMEYLVIDLRNNMGGFDEIACALCDLLTDQDWYGEGLGIRKNGTYTCVSDHCIHGTGEYADLQVVALTNYDCASAGDGASLYLSKLPNVTLAGITDPCGCNQETGGISILADGAVTVRFPTGLILDENGVPNIDTKADRISRNPVEVRIPFDYDATIKIFRDKEDYELDWAVEYLESHVD